jgi:hypothetical protein
VNTSESAVRVWVSEEGRTLKSQFVHDDPLGKRKV